MSRILPLYWLAFAVTLCIAAFGSHPLPGVGQVAWEALLLPTVSMPTLNIAWTLQYEALFYAAFALLIVSRTKGLLLVSVWAAAIALGLAGASLPRGWAVIQAPIVLEFAAGVGAAFLLPMARARRPGIILAAGVLLFLAAMTGESIGVVPVYGAVHVAIYAPAALLLVLGAAACRVRRLPGLGSLGAASYSIYLFQFVFIAVGWQAWQRTPLPVGYGCFVALSAAAIIGGLGVHRWVEQPLLATLRHATRVPRPAVGEQGASGSVPFRR